MSAAERLGHQNRERCEFLIVHLSLQARVSFSVPMEVKTSAVGAIHRQPRLSGSSEPPRERRQSDLRAFYRAPTPLRLGPGRRRSARSVTCTRSIRSDHLSKTPNGMGRTSPQRVRIGAVIDEFSRRCEAPIDTPSPRHESMAVRNQQRVGRQQELSRIRSAGRRRVPARSDLLVQHARERCDESGRSAELVQRANSRCPGPGTLIHSESVKWRAVWEYLERRSTWHDRPGVREDEIPLARVIDPIVRSGEWSPRFFSRGLDHVTAPSPPAVAPPRL